MVDFNLKQSFPIASVIEAGQRKASEQAALQQKGYDTLTQGINSFFEGVNALSERKRQMAQAVKMGTALGMTPDESSGLNPDQIVQVATQKNKVLDLLQLSAFKEPSIVSQPWFQAALAAHAPSTPTATPTQTPAPVASAAMPAPAVAPSPTPAPTLSPAPLTPPTTSSFDVPQTTTTTRPSDLLSKLFSKPMNAATSAAALKMLNDQRQEPVVTKAQAEAQGSVQHGTHILPDEKGPTDLLDPKYQGKLEKQYTDTKMKALSNRSGGLGLQDSKVNQAIDLRKLINKYYDPATGEFNVPPSQHAELALGLARLVSPTGQVGIDLLHELRQSTGREAIAKALIYAGADPAQVGGPTQNVAKMFIDSVDRQGETAEQLRDQYMQYISDNAPTDLDPARKAKHDQGKLNSFNAFLSKAPDRQSHETGGGGVPQVGQMFNGAKVLSVKRVK